MYKILMLAGMLGATALGAALGAAPAPRVVTVRARDFSFEAPAEIAAGTVTFRLRNTGKELHHLWVVQLTNGKTPADFTTAMKTWGSELRMPAPISTKVAASNTAGHTLNLRCIWRSSRQSITAINTAAKVMPTGNS